MLQTKTDDNMISEVGFLAYVKSKDINNKSKSNMQKNWWQSRTMWLAIGQGVVGILLAVYNANPDFSTVGWMMVVKSIIDGYVRLTSTTN